MDEDTSPRSVTCALMAWGGGYLEEVGIDVDTGKGTRRWWMGDTFVEMDSYAIAPD